MGKSTEPLKTLQYVIAETLTQTFMGNKCYRAMRRTEQRHSPLLITKPPEMSGLLPQFGPQFGTISMKDHGGRKTVFAHVNPTTYAKESILPTPLRLQIRGGRKGRAERQGSAQRPNTKKRESSDERLKTLPKNGSFLLSHLVWQYHRR